MVETRRTGAGGPSAPFGGGPVIGSGEGRGTTPARPAGRTPAPGRAGNRWPNPLELAALMVDGILRLPARYRRGMFMDILV